MSQTLNIDGQREITRLDKKSLKVVLLEGVHQSAADALDSAKDITPDKGDGGPGHDDPEPEAGDTDGTGLSSPADPPVDDVDAAFGLEPDAT